MIDRFEATPSRGNFLTAVPFSKKCLSRFRAENERRHLYLHMELAEQNSLYSQKSPYMTHTVAFAAIKTTKTREHFCGKFLYNATASTDNAQHKNRPSSGIDDRPGRDLFRVLKRSPISQPHTLGLRRGYSDGKAAGNATGLQRRLQKPPRLE